MLNSLSSRERQLLSRIVQTLHRGPLMRGSLVLRRKLCGKPRCRCTRGQPHRSLYLTYKLGPTLHQLYIPKSQQGHIRLWIARYREVLDLLEKLSALRLDQVLHRKEEK